MLNQSESGPGVPHTGGVIQEQYSMQQVQDMLLLVGGHNEQQNHHMLMGGSEDQGTPGTYMQRNTAESPQYIETSEFASFYSPISDGGDFANIDPNLPNNFGFGDGLYSDLVT